jgi:hypothetical protein
MEPWGTPTCISLGVDISPATETVNFGSDRMELTNFSKYVENFSFCNLYNKTRCYVSKPFLISKYTGIVEMLVWNLKSRGP